MTKGTWFISTSVAARPRKPSIQAVADGALFANAGRQRETRLAHAQTASKKKTAINATVVRGNSEGVTVVPPGLNENVER